MASLFQTGRVSPRNSSRGGNNNGDSDARSGKSNSPISQSPLHKDMTSEAPNPRVLNGDGMNLGQVAKQSDNLATAPSGAPSATGVLPSTTVPPLSHSSMMGGAILSGMTSIREERETSQP